MLSNGTFTTVVTNSGSGFSQYKDFLFLRWREDPVMDPWGSYIYIRDISKDKFGRHPISHAGLIHLSNVFNLVWIGLPSCGVTEILKRPWRFVFLRNGMQKFVRITLTNTGRGNESFRGYYFC